MGLLADSARFRITVALEQGGALCSKKKKQCGVPAPMGSE